MTKYITSTKGKGLNMCNMKLFLIDRSAAHEEDNHVDDAGVNDVPIVNEIGQTLANIGDKLNEEALRKCKYLRLAAFGIVFTFATIITFNNFP